MSLAQAVREILSSELYHKKFPLEMRWFQRKNDCPIVATNT
jgi:hypothetical protein